MSSMRSNQYKNWITTSDLRTCAHCRSLHGKVYLAAEEPNPAPPLHPNCRCIIESLRALLAGTATNKGYLGADWYLKIFGKLPNYYISYSAALDKGWGQKKGDLHIKCPQSMIFGGIYQNRNGHLPSVPGRIWYEADINYTSGYRGNDRIVYSNDGLIFVTYDHYKTFQVII